MRPAARGLLWIVLLVFGVWAYFRQAEPRIAAARSGSSLGGLPRADDSRASRLAADVAHLSDLGPRHVGASAALLAAEEWLVSALAEAGFRDVRRQEYESGGRRVANLLVEREGRALPGEIVLVGAHYDTFPDSPGANDNGTGVAALLEIARVVSTRTADRTLRLAFFVNEEPPHFRTESMGSLVYARDCAERGEQVLAMLSLDSLGYYSDAPDSQHLPFAVAWMFPSTGHFLAVAGNLESRALVERVSQVLQRSSGLAVESGSLPEHLDGVGWSDHWAFWQHGYPGVVVTDTALYRDPHYHRPSDEAERLDYARLSTVVEGLAAVLEDLLAKE